MANEEKQPPKNPLAKLEYQISTAKSPKDIVRIEAVANRYIANYEAGTGRKDGKEQFEREAFAFIDLANNKPEILKAEPMSIFAGIIKAGLTGLSFSSSKLSVYVRGGKLVVTPDAHGKKEMLERMPTIKKIDEGVVVFKDDVFIVDPHNRKVIKHEQSFPLPKASKDTVKAAYCTIHFSDNHTEDIVMSVDEIEAARKHSQQQDGMMWGQHYGEACKKTTYNRAYKVNYKQPETAVVYKQYDVPETIDTSAEEVVNTDTGEVQEAQVVEPEPEKEKPKKKKPTEKFI